MAFCGRNRIQFCFYLFKRTKAKENVSKGEQESREEEMKESRREPGQG